MENSSRKLHFWWLYETLSREIFNMNISKNFAICCPFQNNAKYTLAQIARLVRSELLTQDSFRTLYLIWGNT